MVSKLFKTVASLRIRGLPDLLRAASRNVSFSQYAEDLFVSRIFQFPQVGCYVDVGAAYPILHSNTYRFYLRGWRGITIEPNPALAKLHRQIRPNDTCISVGVGRGAGSMTYYAFDPPDYNTFDRSVADRLRASGITSLGEMTIPIRALAEILADHLRASSIDLMSVDCEGLDLQVLQSNNWGLYRPSLLVVEDHVGSLANAVDSAVAKYMIMQRYELIARLNYSSVFVATEALTKLVGQAARPKASA